MAIKFQTNIPQTLCFPYGDFMEVSGQYGPQFLYTVEVDGARDRLYATPKLHQQIQALGIEAGSVLTITKVEGEGNRLDWKIGEDTPQEQSEVEERQKLRVHENGTANGQPQAQDKGTPEKPKKPDFISMNRLLELSLRASWDAWHGVDEGAEFSSEDVRAVGITLFLECSRKGVVIAEEDIPLALSA